MSNTETLSALGTQTRRDFANIKEPQPQWLETFKNQHEDSLYLVVFVQPDTTFRSLCPKTGQPDSARMEIVYSPNELMVESKSLKEYLQSFQNSGEFHEDVCNRIANDLFNLMKPKYLRVFGDFVVRGDLAIKPIVERWGETNSETQDSKIARLVDTWDIKK